MAKVALLIGVSDYLPGLTALPAAARDVVALEHILKDPELGGFDQVIVLTNPQPQAMQYAIETLFSGRQREDLALLFFSGHGLKDDSNALHFATPITQTTPRGDLIRATAVPARFIHEVMNHSLARRQVVILDCCFSGAFDPALQAKDDGQVDLQRQLGAEGRVVLTSSSSTQYAFEQPGADLSLYTRYLVDGIQTGAADRNEDGQISIWELHDYAAAKVKETAPSLTPKLITLKEVGFDIVLAQAKVTEPTQRYRRQVEKYARQGRISAVGRTILDQLQRQLNLSEASASQIEAEVLRPYQECLENLHRYRQTLVQAVAQDGRLSEMTQAELADLRQVLGLRPEDVATLEQEVLAQSDATLHPAGGDTSATQPPQSTEPPQAEASTPEPGATSEAPGSGEPVSQTQPGFNRLRPRLVKFLTATLAAASLYPLLVSFFSFNTSSYRVVPLSLAAISLGAWQWLWMERRLRLPPWWLWLPGTALLYIGLLTAITFTNYRFELYASRYPVHFFGLLMVAVGVFLTAQLLAILLHWWIVEPPQN